MTQETGPGKPGDSTGAATKLGLGLVLVGMLSEGAHLLPVQYNCLIAVFGLALIAIAYGSGASLRSRKIVITGVAAVAIALFVSVERLRCEALAHCSCPQAAVLEGWERVLPA